MTLGGLGATAIQMLSGLTILLGLVVSAVSLSAGERLRRRLKTHIEILSSLPAKGPEAAKVQAIVQRDVNELHALEFPAIESQLAKWKRATEIGCVILILFSLTNLLLGLRALYEPSYLRPSAVNLAAMGVILFLVTYADHRRSQAIRALQKEPKT